MSTVEVSQPGIQLPADGTGKVTAGYPITIEGSQVWIPATVLVDGNGQEIGSILRNLLDSMTDMTEMLNKLLLGMQILANEELNET